MYPSHLLPDFVNQLLIVNENVWDENRYWKVTFSDPTLLKQLLLNRLAPDDFSSEVKCYHLKNGSYYLVETERYSYRGDSLSISEKGIGIYSCLRNPDDINTNVVDFSDMIESNYPVDYSKADLFPMYGFDFLLFILFSLLFGDIYSSQAYDSLSSIAGNTNPEVINRLRLYVSYQCWDCCLFVSM